VEHCTIVDDVIRERFAIEYRDFKGGKNGKLSGARDWKNIAI
jgi:hypothetical protein